MPRRSESFDKYVAEKMQNIEYARATLVTSMEHFGDSLEDALKYTITQMGIKEFSEKSGIPVQNISQFIKGRRKPKLETLDKYLAVFNLKAKTIVVDKKDKHVA